MQATPSDVSHRSEGRFEDVTEEVGIAFEHRSSDWLNRLIRSYVFSEDSNVAKLSIPPAFGGAGVACEDINNDGLPDLLLLGGVGNRLYLNSLSGKFLETRILAGRGLSAVPYVHVQDLAQCLLRIVEKSAGLPQLSIVNAGPDGTVSHLEIFW